MEKFKPSLLSLQMQCRSLQVMPEAMLQVCRGGHFLHFQPHSDTQDFKQMPFLVSVFITNSSSFFFKVPTRCPVCSCIRTGHVKLGQLEPLTLSSSLCL